VSGSVLPSVAIESGKNLSVQAAGSTTIYGDLAISSNSTYVASNTQTVKGNFNNSGTFTAGSSTVVMNGTAAQTISGASSTSFNNLSLNNGAGAVAIQSATSVNGTLTLSSTNASLSSADLTINASGSISGNSSSAYIITSGSGSLIRSVGSGAVTFPVGTSTSYTPVVMNNAGTLDNYSIRVQPSIDNNPMGNQLVNLQWTVSEQVPGGSNAAMSLQWNGSNESASFSRTGTVNLATWNGSYYDTKLVSISGTDPYLASVTGVTSFGPMVVGNDNAFPILLESISAIVSNRTIFFQWRTATERNSAGFEIEFSFDRLHWTSIGFVQAAGMSFEPLDYSYSVPVPNSYYDGRTVYYHLKMIDRDGSFKYSPVLTIRQQEGLITTIAVRHFPEPAHSFATIDYQLPKDAAVCLTLYEATGTVVRQILTGDIRISGSHSVTVPLEGLPSGMYFYRLASGGEVQTRRIMLVR